MKTGFIPHLIPVAEDPPPDYTLLTPPPPYTASMEEEYLGRYQNIDNPFSFQTSNTQYSDCGQ